LFKRTLMEYTKKHRELKKIFSPLKEQIQLPGSGVRILNTDFISDEPQHGFFNKSDYSIPENNHFSFPVFIPEDRKSSKIILLLHGLNERSWSKYLVWAYYLARQTQSYVILFPISLHINRSPVTWTDPHSIIPLMNDPGRISERSTFANFTISNRLAEDPLRFFYSGYRTVFDILKLITSLKNGRYPLLPTSFSVNIFSYSIGSFLSEILMMANPFNLFSKSKLFMLCGGSVFSRMHGTSKLIMDKRAFEKIFSYYMHDFEKLLLKNNDLSSFLHTDRLGLSFRSMIDFSKLKKFRNQTLGGISSRIRAISLTCDQVIPPEGIKETLSFNGTVRVYDPPYTCSHENPFPVLENEAGKKIDRFFDRIMSEAFLFLC
jgi:hypothetical protein